MFFFDKLFGRKSVQRAPSDPPLSTPAPAGLHQEAAGHAPGTAIHYDPHLIQQLHADHEVLLGIFGDIAAASAAGDLGSAQRALGQFRTGLMDHLLKENVRLYIYLEHLLEGDEVSHGLMHGFRREMDSIGRVVVGFLGKYQDIGTRPDKAASFATDLAGIGAALTARIRREEDTLYPMYQPPEP